MSVTKLVLDSLSVACSLAIVVLLFLLLKEKWDSNSSSLF